MHWFYKQYVTCLLKIISHLQVWREQKAVINKDYPLDTNGSQVQVFHMYLVLLQE